MNKDTVQGNVAEQPNIADKLLFLGFQACSANQDVYKSAQFDNLTIRLDQQRLLVSHMRDGESFEAVMHAKAALNNIHLENHVRGVVRTEFGVQAAKQIKNFPYSETRIAPNLQKALNLQ